METKNELEKLKKENKKLKTRNLILTIYVAASLLIMIYNKFLG
jgi:hypothetical protein